MKKRIRLCMLAGVLSVILLSGCAGSGSDSRTQENPDQTGSSPSTSQESPEPSDGADSADTESPALSTNTVSFEAATIDGTAMSSDLFSDSRITMVNVWATYCSPCLSEMPELGELATEYDSADFQLIGIISDVMDDADSDQIDYAAELIEQTGAAYPHLLLNESLYYALLTDVTAVPTTFFVDENGVVLGTVIGARDKTSWKEIIDALLEE